MELSQPPPYASPPPSNAKLPSIPGQNGQLPRGPSDITLPDLKTVLSPGFDHLSSPHAAHPRQQSPVSVRSLPPIDTGPGYNHSAGGRNSMESAVMSPSDAGSMMSTEGRRSTSAVSIDDEKVRIAAEALSGLGNPGFVHSPRTSTTSREGEPSTLHEPEPLLQLFAKAHPWVGGTINGSLNAYSTTKQYSPRFVQYGANIVERNITTPVVSTVSTVGRMTGVESGLRWYYGGSTGGNGSRPHDLEDGPEDGATPVHPDQVGAMGGFLYDSSDVISEPLPAYHPNKPPSYREQPSPSTSSIAPSERPAHNRSWSSHVFVMTSGLGVALSDTSRRSLVYCLNMLGQAAQHVQTATDALRLVLQQYDHARDAWQQNNHDKELEAGEAGDGVRTSTPEHDEAARRLAELIKKHSDDIWDTLKTVVNYVSASTGGALPENARHFVRTQLLSMPQRWRYVSENQNQTGDEDSETSRGAHRMIAFATEGLDMMGQVSQTMKLTLDSAEKWLARVGRRGEETHEGVNGHSNPDAGDVDMTDSERQA